MADLGE